jgi:hypothetical protein
VDRVIVGARGGAGTEALFSRLAERPEPENHFDERHAERFENRYAHTFPAEAVLATWIRSGDDLSTKEKEGP